MMWTLIYGQSARLHFTIGVFGHLLGVSKKSFVYLYSVCNKDAMSVLNHHLFGIRRDGIRWPNHLTCAWTQTYQRPNTYSRLFKNVLAASFEQCR